MVRTLFFLRNRVIDIYLEALIIHNDDLIYISCIINLIVKVKDFIDIIRLINIIRLRLHKNMLPEDIEWIEWIEHNELFSE